MRRKGYTLIELLVVVALLAVLTALIVPTYQLLLAQAELTSAANQTVDFLTLTQQQTVTQQTIYGVTLVTDATSIPQYTYDPTTGSKSCPTAQVPTCPTVFSLPSNMKIGSVNFSGQSDIRFSTAGAPNVSGNLVINDTVRNRNRQVTISPSGSITDNQAEY